MAEERVLHTADGEVLEAEFRASADSPRGGVVLCHPDPRGGGTMRSIVISALFEALPARGYSCLRFNFRGVERSTGTRSGGKIETVDVVAALDAMTEEVPGRPLVLAGWSFGADMALSVPDPRVSAWVGIAPPLRFRESFGEVGKDERPKHLVLAQHDEFRPPDEVAGETADWVHTTSVVVPGASHFFIGRTDRVTDEVDAFLASLR